MSPDAKLAELLNPKPPEPKPPEPIVLKPGVHAIDRTDYDQVQAVNFSRLKNIGRSPAHYLAALKGAVTETDEMRLGRAVHLAIFEPKIFEKCVVRWEGKVRNGKAWEEFEADHCGELILTAKQHADCLELSAAVRRHPLAKPYLTEGASEVTLRWDLEKTADGFPGWKFPCKGRVDRLTPNFIADVKTTFDAEPEHFAKSAWNLDYAVQGAWYVDGHKAITGRRLPYVLIVVEKEPPFEVLVFRLSDLSYRLGRERYRTWLDTLAHCNREKRWPGYAEGELELDPPSWVLRQLENET